MEKPQSYNPENDNQLCGWMVVVSGTENIEPIVEAMSGMGCEDIDKDGVVEIENEEYMVVAVGPANLPELLASDERVTGVFPNSRIDFFDPEGGQAFGDFGLH